MMLDIALIHELCSRMLIGGKYFRVITFGPVERELREDQVFCSREFVMIRTGGPSDQD